MILVSLPSFGACREKEVPNWVYRIGQSMQDRIHLVKLENRTNYAALKAEEHKEVL